MRAWTGSHWQPSRRAAGRAAQDSCVLPAAQQSSVSEPTSAGCWGDHAAAPTSKPWAGVRQAQAASASSGAATGGSGCKHERPAGGKTGAEEADDICLPTTALGDAWQAFMAEDEPYDKALSAAADRAAKRAEEAMGRSALAGRPDPLPQRASRATMRATLGAPARSTHADMMGRGSAEANLHGAMAEMGRLRAACAGLVSTAHSAGMTWLMAREGPDLEAGRAWCAEFVRVSTGVHSAGMQAEVCLKWLSVLLPRMDEDEDKLLGKMEGAGRLLLRLLLTWVVPAVPPSMHEEWGHKAVWSVLLAEGAVLCAASSVQVLLCARANLALAVLAYCLRLHHLDCLLLSQGT